VDEQPAASPLGLCWIDSGCSVRWLNLRWSRNWFSIFKKFRCKADSQPSAAHNYSRTFEALPVVSGRNRTRSPCEISGRAFCISGAEAVVEQKEILPVLVEKEPWWMNVVKQLGLPTFLLLIMSWGVYQSATWFGTTILIPLTDRQLTFINQVDESVQKITTIVEEHQKNNGLIARELESINAGIKVMNIETKSNGERLENIEKVLNKGNQQ
jgi:hypothetical protein